MGNPEKLLVLELGHRRAVHTFDANLKITQHIHQHKHNMDFENIKITND